MFDCNWKMQVIIGEYDAMAISAKTTDRITAQIKKFQPILSQAVAKDENESDTSVIICDMLCDVFGYDKYRDVSTQHAIKGLKADFEIIVDGTARFLVEAKAVGVALKDSQVTQVVTYGANQGTEWVILTNGQLWRLYKIHFGQPINSSLLCEIDVLNVSPKNSKWSELIECFGNLSRENFSKPSMNDYFEQKQLTSKYAVAAAILSEPMLIELRRELRRLSSGLKLDVDYLATLITNEVIKRDLIDSDEGKNAQALIRHLQKSYAKDKERSEIEEKGSAQSTVQIPTQSQQGIPE